MAYSTAVISCGSTISVSATVGGSYVALAEICGISDDASVKAIKVTHLLSDGAAHEYIPGIIEPGNVMIEFNFTKAQYAAFYAALRVAQFYKITDTDGSVTGPFKGFYTKLSKKLVEDDRINGSVEIKRTGTLAFTAAP